MWKVEVLVRQRVEGALREGEQARLGKEIRGARRKRIFKHWPDPVQFGVWFCSLFRAEEQKTRALAGDCKVTRGMKAQSVALVLGDIVAMVSAPRERVSTGELRPEREGTMKRILAGGEEA
jgi:hypothetical protein